MNRISRTMPIDMVLVCVVQDSAPPAALDCSMGFKRLKLARLLFICGVHTLARLSLNKTERPSSLSCPVDIWKSVGPISLIICESAMVAARIMCNAPLTRFHPTVSTSNVGTLQRARSCSRVGITCKSKPCGPYIQARS